MTLIFLAYALGIFIATHSFMSSDVPLAIAQILVVPVFRGIMYSLPYRADRLIGSRLGAWGRSAGLPTGLYHGRLDTVAVPRNHQRGIACLSQYDNLALMQVVSITGMWGLTFLIAWFATTVNLLWEHHFDWRPVRNQILLFATVLLAALIFGSARLHLRLPQHRRFKWQPSPLTIPSTRQLIRLSIG